MPSTQLYQLSACAQSWFTSILFFFNIYLFWLRRVLVAARGIFSCGIQPLRCGMWDLAPWPGIEPGPPEPLDHQQSPSLSVFWYTSLLSLNYCEANFRHMLLTYTFPLKKKKERKRKQKTFCFEIILDSQEVAKIRRGFPCTVVFSSFSR